MISISGMIVKSDFVSDNTVSNVFNEKIVRKHHYTEGKYTFNKQSASFCRLSCTAQQMRADVQDDAIWLSQ